MNPPDARYHSKNRIAAVDITRLLAAMLVMYEHLHRQTAGMGGSIIRNFEPWFHSVFSTLSPMFFLLAGYFVCRNLTWKKALNNSWWTFAPFVLWNGLCILIVAIFSTMPEHYNIASLFGLRSILFGDWLLFPGLNVTTGFPLNGPLWFMRDLVLLFLFSPLILKSAKIVFPACLIASLTPQFAPCFGIETNDILLSLRSIAFFSAGCLMQTFSKEFQKKALSFYSPAIIIAYITITLTDHLFFQTITTCAQLVFCKNLMAIWVIYQIARWIEVSIPAATPFALKYAPVTFLTFAAHKILYILCALFIAAYWPEIAFKDGLLALPLLFFVLLAGFFFSLKRWCPSLLHLVAHYKLRPDDLKPKATETPQSESAQA